MSHLNLKEKSKTKTDKGKDIAKKEKQRRALIHTYPIQKYKGFKIYIRSIATKIWEYWVIIDGQPYTAHAIIKPSWWKRWFKEPYNYFETQGAIRLIRAMAETTIDTILNNKKNAKHKKSK